MKTIVATDVLLKSNLPLHAIMNIYKEIKGWGGEVFLIQNRKMVAATSLSKLIAFMLTVDEKTPIKMIVEGTNSQEFHTILKEKMENYNQFKKETMKFEAAVN